MIRLLSLDVFRGITMAIMILVNSPGNQFSYSFLKHSTWNGCTLADLVFPFFIIIVGISSVLALTHLKEKGVTKQQLFKTTIKRSIYLFAWGLLLNIFPNHFDYSHLRILGVLQRIAMCYLFSSLLFLTTSIRVQIIIIATLLIGYWLFMCQFSTINTLSIHQNLVGYWDQKILSPQHLYTPIFDPEGLLSTFPAIGSVLLGNVIGTLLISSRTQQQQFQELTIAGFTLAILGLLWHNTFPINKSLWSSSYVLWSGGLGFLTFAICFALIEIKHILYWSKPFSLLGKNALLVYILHIMLLKIQAIILMQHHGELINLRCYITDQLFGHFSAKNASFCYAASHTLLWLFILICITNWRLRPSQTTDKE